METKRKTWDRLIEELTRGMDLSRPESKRKAYENCVVYAERNMRKDPMLNMFLSHAATRLGATPVTRDVTREIVPMPENARAHIAFDYNEGPALTANREGLRYLSELFEVLAGSPVMGDHLRLNWDETPLWGETYGLTVYIEEDEWFEEQAFDGAGEEDLQFPRRDIEADNVMAIQFATNMCSSLCVTPGKLYLVKELAKRSSQDAWSKVIRDDDSRVWVFSIEDDHGDDKLVSVDLDDPDINFLTREDLAQMVH